MVSTSHSSPTLSVVLGNQVKVGGWLELLEDLGHRTKGDGDLRGERVSWKLGNVGKFKSIKSASAHTGAQGKYLQSISEPICKVEPKRFPLCTRYEVSLLLQLGSSNSICWERDQFQTLKVIKVSFSQQSLATVDCAS